MHVVRRLRRPDPGTGLGAANGLVTRAAAASRSTPTLLWTWLVVVASLLGLTCAAAVVAASAQQAATTEITERIEPLSADAAAVYRALADADTTLICGYLRPGGPSAEDRQRYDDDIAAAAAGLAAAAGRADDPATADRIAYLGRQLPVYTGLVEQARAADRQEQAGAHLTRASELMQSSVLPVAESLQQRKSRALSAAFDRTQSVPVTALVLAVITLVCLVVLQVVVARRFRRVLNAGLLAATVLLVLGLGWWTVAAGSAGTLLGAAREHGRAVNEALVPAQIAALQARATEGENLVGRADGGQDRAFADRMQRLARDGGAGGALGASARLAADPATRARIVEAVAAATEYRDAHQHVQRAVAEGRLPEATALALAEGAGGTSAVFERLDAALVAAVGTERRAFAERTAAAATWRSALGVGSVVVTLLALAAVWWGLRSRLLEYRDPLHAVPRRFRGAAVAEDRSPGGSP